MKTGYIRLERSVTDKQNDLENCPNSNTNLLIAWTHCIKAFDSVPHSRIKKCLETFKILTVSSNFLSHSRRMWKTTLVLNTEENTLNAGDININNNIFQGNSLSPVLFCAFFDKP